MSKSKAHQICAAGGVELVIGRGPPILTANHEVIDIGGEYWLLARSHWRPSLPVRARATWLDLTRRKVRFQIIGGLEVLYEAEIQQSGSGSTYFVFSNFEHAKANAIGDAKSKVKSCEDGADAKLKELEEAKSHLARAESLGDGTERPA